MTEEAELNMSMFASKEDYERARFEAFFAASRSGKGARRRPTFERLADGTYMDDSTQRHWWTWQNAIAESS